MSYDPKKLTKLAALKALAIKTKETTDALGSRVKTLEDAGFQANVLEGVKVNGVAQAIADKMVDILIATGNTDGTISVAGVEVAIKGLAAMAYKANVSEADLAEALATKLGNKADKTYVDGLVSSVYKPAGSVAYADLPAAAEAVLGNVYNVTNAFTTDDRFVEGTNKKHPAGTNVVVVKVDEDYKYDVLAGFVDLSEYIKAADVESTYVPKNGTDRLMTAAEGQKLAGIAEGATKVEASETDGNLKINGVETTIFGIATDAEVTEMINEVFAPAQV